MSRKLIVGILLILFVAGCGTKVVSGVAGPFLIQSIDLLEDGTFRISTNNTYPFCIGTKNQEFGNKILKMYKENPNVLYQADWHSAKKECSTELVLDELRVVPNVPKLIATDRR